MLTDIAHMDKMEFLWLLGKSTFLTIAAMNTIVALILGAMFLRSTWEERRGVGMSKFVCNPRHRRPQTASHTQEEL